MSWEQVWVLMNAHVIHLWAIHWVVVVMGLLALPHSLLGGIGVLVQS